MVAILQPLCRLPHPHFLQRSRKFATGKYVINVVGLQEVLLKVQGWLAFFSGLFLLVQVIQAFNLQFP